jgi:REP element-mobilizing transposase RayT
MRVARLFAPGSVHHVISRLVDRRFFLDADEARARYLSLLGRSLAPSDWRCLAYALMSNHIHLVMAAGQEEPECWLKRVHSPFAHWLNKSAGGLGPIFADRPKVRIVADEKVGHVIAYVHNNPVRAEVVQTAAESTWTSHRAYLGVEPAPRWLDVDDGMRRAGFSDAGAFDSFVRADVDSPDLDETATNLEERVRPLAHRRGLELATTVLSQTPQVQLVRRRDAMVRPTPLVVIETVCFIARAEPERARCRGEKELRALVLATGKRIGLSLSELCAALGVSRQYGHRILRDASVDQAQLELAVRFLVDGRWVNSVDKGSTVPPQVPGMIAGRRRRG